MKTLRSGLKIRFAFSSVCVHKLAAVAAATAATTGLPYRHRHHRYHHHQHHTAHKSTTAGLLTTAGGVSATAPLRVPQIRPPSSFIRCILHFQQSTCVAVYRNFSTHLRLLSCHSLIPILSSLGSILSRHARWPLRWRAARTSSTSTRCSESSTLAGWTCSPLHL